MKAKVNVLPIRTGGLAVVVLEPSFARELDVQPMDRVVIKKGENSTVATVDYYSKESDDYPVGVFEEVAERLELNSGDTVDISIISKPQSLEFIKKKLDGEELTSEEIRSIVADIVNDMLTDTEISMFVAAIYTNGMTMNETVCLTRAIAETGSILKFDKDIVVDKHCVGGVPGNRTTMIIVPIMAALGYTMPKISSRAITSPAGTADTMEVLAPVTFSSSEIKRIVDKVGACIAWGGGSDVASADDKMIRVRRPLSLDPEPLLLSSILAKKYAMGATHLIIDIPVAQDAKTRDIGEARVLEKSFVRVAEGLGIKTVVMVSDGDQPIGDGVGPLLEARDVVKVLKNHPQAPKDLREKALRMVAKLLVLVGRVDTEEEGYKLASKTLDKGKAWKKMKEIIAAQGGDPNVNLNKLRPSKISYDIKSQKKGVVSDIDNHVVARVCRILGAPETKEAGVLFYKKYGAKVRKGQVIATLYAASETKLSMAISYLKKHKMFDIK